MEIPRSRSMAIQSLVAWRVAFRAFTDPARWIAPPYSSSFSVSVVLPASGCEMIAKVRRRATSAASGERDGDSVAMARSDMGLSRLAGKPDRIKQDRHSPYMDCARELQFAGVFAYRTSD